MNVKFKGLKNNKGFTLGELLIVVAIIGVLVAVSIPIFSGQIDKAKVATCETNRAAAEHSFIVERMTDEESTNQDILTNVKLRVFGVNPTGCPVEGATYSYTFYDLEGNVTTGDATDAYKLKITCSIEGHGKHKSKNDTNDYLNEEKAWTEFLDSYTADWTVQGGRGPLYKEYYKNHTAEQLDPAYVKSVLGDDFTTPLYWIPSVIKDRYGQVYTVYYASPVAGGAAYYNSPANGVARQGYIARVEGKTFKSNILIPNLGNSYNVTAQEFIQKYILSRGAVEVPD